MGVTREMYCGTCASLTPFELCDAIAPPAAPPVDDGHEECTEWACTRCGEAIVLAPLSTATA